MSVVLKALAKLAFDLNFNNRRPSNSEELYPSSLEQLPSIDFSHSNPMWNYYSLTEEQRESANLAGLKEYLPEETPGVNRDIGSMTGPAKAHFRIVVQEPSAALRALTSMGA